MLRGLADSKSDGIIQVSTGGGAFASGSSLKDMSLGAIAIAEHVHRAAERYPIYVALHTDHCLGFQSSARRSEQKTRVRYTYGGLSGMDQHAIANQAAFDIG